MVTKPILVPLSGQMALKIIRDAAVDSSRVFLTHHANARTRYHEGRMECTVEHYTAGEQIGVAVGIESVQATGIVVITGFHVDGLITIAPRVFRGREKEKCCTIKVVG
jgi:hypothetical protein